MPHLPLSSTTHTLEVSQVNDLNDKVTEQQAERITAADLQLSEKVVKGQSPLPGSAVLVHVSWSGAPEYPFVYGHFGHTPGERAVWMVELHTEALRALGHRLHLHQVWGIGSATP